MPADQFYDFFRNIIIVLAVFVLFLIVLYLFLVGDRSREKT